MAGPGSSPADWREGSAPTFSPRSLATCLLSFMSHLFPRSILSTSDDACCKHQSTIHQICQDEQGVRDRAAMSNDVARRGREGRWRVRTCTYLFDVAHPVPDVIEGLLIGDVIDQHNPLQTGSDISPALPGCFDIISDKLII